VVNLPAMDSHYFVYILNSIGFPDRFYIGFTCDIEKRLEHHNSGGDAYTAKFKPWKIKTYIAFHDKERALAFERYLKTASGRAFAKKRL
jgi:predicted GIY-YIG superfamily endonuclease